MADVIEIDVGVLLEEIESALDAAFGTDDEFDLRDVQEVIDEHVRELAGDRLRTAVGPTGE